MNKGRIMLFAMLAAVTIVLAVFASFFASSQADSEVPKIELPQELPGGIEPGASIISSEPAPEVGEVTAENLSALVLSLERPEEYYATISVELFWQEGSARSTRELWSTGGYELIRTYTEDGAPGQNCIVAGENTYIWQEGDAQYYLGSTGSFSTDDAARIPTYEDLADVEPQSVAACYYEASGDIPCLYAETVDSLGQVNKWWVSLSSGLLWKFETWDADTLAYRMQTMSLSTDAVDRGQFILPDGNSVFDAG